MLAQESTYLIGGGAVLEAGPHATITRATLHAQLAGEAHDASLVLVDFESTLATALQRLVVIAPGWSAQRFEAAVTPELLAAGVCAFTAVVAIAARATGARRALLLARWLPDEPSLAELRARGVELTVRPLGELG